MVIRSTGAELAGEATLLLGTLSLLLWIRTRDELRLEMVRPRLANTKSKRGFLPVSNEGTGRRLGFIPCVANW